MSGTKRRFMVCRYGLTVKRLKLSACRISRNAVLTLSNFNELKSKQNKNSKSLHVSIYLKTFNQSKIFNTTPSSIVRGAIFPKVLKN